jgi:putative ABC transport system permease protein
MLRATLRSLLARKLRLVLSALAVVVGVSFVVGTFVLTDTLNHTFDTLFSTVNAKVNVQVRSVSAFDDTNADAVREPLSASLVPKIAAVDGVRAAVGSVSGTAQLIDPKTHKAVGNSGAPPIGIAWNGGTPVSTATIATGRPPARPGEIAVDKSTAGSSHLALGTRIDVQTKGPPAIYTMVGTFRIGGQDSLGGATVTAFDPATAQRVLLSAGHFSAVDVAAKGGVSQTALRDRVSAVLPKGVEAITGKELSAESASSVKKAIGGFSTFLLVFAFISVFVGAFIIFNTFSMLVAQRVRELALLRALGASRGQVRRSVQVEAAAVGFVGASAGLVLGGGLAVVLRALTAAFGAKLPSGGLVFAPRTFIAAYAVGLIVTGVAAFVPGRKAASVPPVAAMRETWVLPTRSLRLRGALGSVLVVGGAALLTLGLTSVKGKQATISVGGGALVCFLGIATLSPLLARPVTRLIGAPLPALFGATGNIGRENAMRNPRRTASTASALMIGLAVVSAFAVLGASIKQSVRDTVRNSLGADYILTAGKFGAVGFSPDVARSLTGKPGVQLATGLRGAPAKVHGSTTQVLAADPAALPDVLGLKKVAGNLGGLPAGSILVASDTAKSDGITVGQRLGVIFPETGATTLTVAGTYEANALAGKYVISTAEFERHYHNSLDMVVLVKRVPSADPVATGKLIRKTVAPFGNVDVRDQSQFIAQEESNIDALLGFVYVLLVFAVVIALFGIVNTLALSVIERTREIGLLRAIGMTRGQLRTMVRLEAVVISVFGAILGVVVGSLFGWAMTSALRSQGITSFAYPAVTIVCVVFAGGVLGVVAAIFPARRAAKMDILRAIATT